MLPVFAILVLLAMLFTILSAMGKAPLWAAVFLLCLIELLRIAPLGKL